MKKIWTDRELHDLGYQLLQHRINERAVILDLAEFQKLYGFIIEMAKHVPQLSLVKTLSSEVFAQFSDISPQHFIIVNSEALSPESFRFASSIKWHGAVKRPQRFWEFLAAELRDNFAKLSVVLIASVILLFLADSSALYELVATLLIQSGTVFLSIYLIFTVSQNLRLAEDRDLFETGVTQRYFRDDRNITFLGILTIALTFFNSMFISVLDSMPIASPEIGVLLRAGSALTTSVVVVLLFDCFLVVSSYYLGRTMDVVERDVVSDILHDDFKINDQ
jgi:hypothetical protein